jgi:hypothetical protein
MEACFEDESNGGEGDFAGERGFLNKPRSTRFPGLRPRFGIVMAGDENNRRVSVASDSGRTHSKAFLPGNPRSGFRALPRAVIRALGRPYALATPGNGGIRFMKE